MRGVLGNDGHLALPFFVARRILEAGLRERVEHAPVDSGDPALLEWLATRLGTLREECLLAIFLDARQGFLAEECFASGTRDCVEIAPRTLFRRAMNLDCSALLLAHNHPSGSAAPSAMDIAATRRVVEHGKLLDIALVDHLIVGGNTVMSMKRAGLL